MASPIWFKEFPIYGYWLVEQIGSYQFTFSQRFTTSCWGLFPQLIPNLSPWRIPEVSRWTLRPFVSWPPSPGSSRARCCWASPPRRRMNGSKWTRRRWRCHGAMVPWCHGVPKDCEVRWLYPTKFVKTRGHGESLIEVEVSVGRSCTNMIKYV